MPELPEVEVVTRGLRNLCGYVFSETAADAKFQTACTALVGTRLESVLRRGKYILFVTEQRVAVSHLRMTGKWFITSEPVVTKHVRFWFKLVKDNDVRWLTFVDPRKFGIFDVVVSEIHHHGWASLGYDGLDLDKSYIVDNVVKKAFQTKVAIKQFLLDQTVIAGCGNIYASCVLWRAQVDPRTPTKEIPAFKLREICAKLRILFLESIAAGGTSASDYLDTTGAPGLFQLQLQVYGRGGEPCSRCQATVQRIVQAGRSTFFCPQCQVSYGNHS